MSHARAPRRRTGYSPAGRRGYWWAELTADTTLESDYILLQLWLHPPVERRLEPAHAAADRQGGPLDSRPAAAGRRLQYLPKGPSEISATVKAYFALKLAGIPTTIRAGAGRERILALGGIQAANSYVKINLSLFDLYPARICARPFRRK